MGDWRDVKPEGRQGAARTRCVFGMRIVEQPQA